jgi:F-type H+-transporting ATPase subunit b
MLDISVGILMFMVVLFLALIYVLNKIMYVPLMEFMKKRDKSIADDMASVSSNDGEIHALEEEAQKNISEAKARANEIKTSLISKAKEEIAKAYEAKKLELEKEMDSFLTELASKREALKSELSANIGQYKSGLEAKLKNI